MRTSSAPTARSFSVSDLSAGAVNPLRLLAVYAISLAGLIGIMSTDFRPEPLFANIHPDFADKSAFPGLAQGEPLIIEFDAPGDDLNAIYWGEFFATVRQWIDVSLYNVTQDRPIGTDILHSTDVVSDFHAGNNRPGDRLRLTMSWRKDIPPRIPLIKTKADANEPTSFPYPADRAQVVPGIVRVDGMDHAKNAMILFSKERLSKKHSDEDTPTALDPNLLCDEWLELKQEQIAEIEVIVPREGLRVISIPGLLRDTLSKARIEIQNLTSGKELASSVAKDGLPWEKPLDTLKAGDRLLLKIQWDSVPPPTPLHPSVPPSLEVQAFAADGTPAQEPPAMIAHYRWPSRRALWLWLTFSVLLVIAIREPRFRPTFLVLFGLMAAATGMLGWQQQYSGFAAHLDPDFYGAYAEHLAQYVTGSDDAHRAAEAHWFHEYSNAEVPLVSFVLAVFLLLGIPLSPGYLWLVAMCSFSVLLIVYHILRNELRLNSLTSLLAVVALGCHLAILKSFDKPSPDMMGLLLTTLMLAGILWRFREATRRQTLFLTLLPLLLLLARHGTPAYLPFYATGILAADITRRRSFQPWRDIGNTALIILPSVLIYGGAFLAFDWKHNFLRAMNSNRNDTAFHGFKELATVMIALLQFFALSGLLLLPTLRRRCELRPAILIAGAWIIYFTLFMLTINASMVQRLFLPILPAVFILFACCIDRTCEQRPRMVIACTIAICAINVAAACYAIHLPYLPPVQIARFIF
jgi:hypothetical protein